MWSREAKNVAAFHVENGFGHTHTNKIFIFTICCFPIIAAELDVESRALPWPLRDNFSMWLSAERLQLFSFIHSFSLSFLINIRTNSERNRNIKCTVSRILFYNFHIILSPCSDCMLNGWDREWLAYRLFILMRMNSNSWFFLCVCQRVTLNYLFHSCRKTNASNEAIEWKMKGKYLRASKANCITLQQNK